MPMNNDPSKPTQDTVASDVVARDKIGTQINYNTYYGALVPALAEDGENAEMPRAGLLADYLREAILTEDLGDFYEALHGMLIDGQVLLLLDGLDEVNNAGSPHRQKQIATFVDQLQNDFHCPIIVTSRPSGYKTHFLERVGKGFGRVELVALEDEHQQTLAETLSVLKIVSRWRTSSRIGRSALCRSSATTVLASPS